MCAEQALDHQWLSGKDSATITYPIHHKVLMNLHGCHHAHELHFQLLIVFTQFLVDKEIREIRETFQSIDTDYSGDMDVEELMKDFEELKGDKHVT